MKKVMIFGTFDGLHPGHHSFISQAKALGDYLIIVVGLDQTVKLVKNKLPKHNQDERLKTIQSIPGVSLAILGNPSDRYAVIREHAPDIIGLGYDQTHFTEKLQALFPEITIVRLKPFEEHIYKTSLLKNL